MEWLSQNWVWAVFFAAFIAMHMFGHGGHGGHSGHASQRDNDQNGAHSPRKDGVPGASRQGSGHRH